MPLLSQPTNILNSPYLYIIIDIFSLIVFLIAFLFLIRAFLRQRNFLPAAFQKIILLITVPKDLTKEQTKEKEIDFIRSEISVMEALFSTLGGLPAQRGLKAWLFGRTDHFSLEIVSHRGLICFYIVVSKYLQQYLEQQILAQFPQANITEVSDYNIFLPHGVILGSYLRFARPYIFPLNTYKKINTDPLNAITNAMVKIAPDGGLAIQIVARSAKKAWHRWGSKVAGEMQQGKTLTQALKATGGFSLIRLIKFFSTKPPKEKKEPHRLSPMEEELIKGLEEKTSKAGLDTNIRVIAVAKNKAVAKNYLRGIMDSFSQFNYYQYGNNFSTKETKTKKIIRDFIYRNYRESKNVLLNVEELASIYHFPLPYTETPSILWLMAKKIAAPPNLPSQGLLLGENIYHGVSKKIYIKTDDRRRHLYIIGMTGTGKSTLMEEMAKQDILAGRGVCIVDPHGSVIENILTCIPKERFEEVIIFDPSDVERPVGLNMLEAETPHEEDFAVQEMITIFYKLFPPEIIGPMFEHNMRNAMLTLMADKESPGTIVDIPRIFTDPDFQRYKLQKVTDPVVRAFWEKEMAKTSDFHKSEMLGYLISKVGRFVENRMMRNIIGQSKSGFSFREVMDKQKILLVNLSKGKTGEVNSSLLGLIIVSKLQMAALARADLSEEKRKDFYLYIDEFQNFITDSIATILSEARKYRLNLTLAHQYIGQLVQGSDTKIRDAVFGNVGTMICFRIGVEDTEIMAKQFEPVVSEYDLMNIEKYNAYLKLLVDNANVRPFNVRCFPPTFGEPALATQVKEMSRQKYGRPLTEVEVEILERSRLGTANVSRPPMIEKSL